MEDSSESVDSSSEDSDSDYMQVVPNASNSTTVAVMMNSTTMVLLDEQCTRVLVYPNQV